MTLRKYKLKMVYKMASELIEKSENRGFKQEATDCFPRTHVSVLLRRRTSVVSLMCDALVLSSARSLDSEECRGGDTYDQGCPAKRFSGSVAGCFFLFSATTHILAFLSRLFQAKSPHASSRVLQVSCFNLSSDLSGVTCR